jgi:hypothetical protein
MSIAPARASAAIAARGIALLEGADGDLAQQSPCPDRCAGDASGVNIAP